MPQDTAKPITKWQALRERLALVRSKLATWWSGADRWNDALGNHPFIALGILAVLLGLALLLLAPRWAGQAVDPLASVVPPAADQQLAELAQRVAALEADIAAKETPSPSPWPDPKPPTRATAIAPRAALRAPAPPAQPQGEQTLAWGETDLDRAIANFNPPASPFGAKP